MSDWPNPAPEVEDGTATGVALVGRDARGEFVITACNDAFLRMTGSARNALPATSATSAIPAFPIAFDALVPAAVRPAFAAKLAACLASGAAQELDLAQASTDAPAESARRARVSLTPIPHAHGTQVLVTGLDPAAPYPDAASAARYHAVVDSAYDAIVTIDQQHNITLFNHAAENLFGYTAGEVLGQPIVMLLPEQFRAKHPHNVQTFADTVQTRVRRMTPPRMDGSNSVYGLHRNGSIIPVEIAIAKIDVNGATEFTAVVRDITDRAELMQALKKQAVTDALTGLPNRREFLDFVDKALGANTVLSVFILDIDFFKNINDTHGHDAGDEVLRMLGNVGMSIPHAPTLFARWGGEEFVAALPGADADTARAIAETLRGRIEKQDVEHAWRVKPIPFTVSIGVVTRDTDDRDVGALMKRADRALYRAKESGRNRVEVG